MSKPFIGESKAQADSLGGATSDSLGAGETDAESAVGVTEAVTAGGEIVYEIECLIGETVTLELFISTLGIAKLAAWTGIGLAIGRSFLD